MTWRRWLVAGTITLAAAMSAFWMWGAALAWSICCGWLVSRDFAIAISVGAALNVVGLVIFLIRRQSWGALVLGALQVGNIVFALVASVAVSPAWLLDALAALVILILTVLLHRSRALSAGC